MSEAASTVDMCGNSLTELDTAGVREMPENGYKSSEDFKGESTEEQSDV